MSDDQEIRFRVSISLNRAFKVECAIDGASRPDVLRKLIYDWIVNRQRRRTDLGDVEIGSIEIILEDQ
jgi:hypothetical protein